MRLARVAALPLIVLAACGGSSPAGTGSSGGSGAATSGTRGTSSGSSVSSGTASTSGPSSSGGSSASAGSAASSTGSSASTSSGGSSTGSTTGGSSTGGAECVIAGATWPAGSAQPGSDCGVCDPAQSTSAWSPRPLGWSCGAAEVCDVDGTCTAGCFASGAIQPPGAVDPNDPCLGCAPEVSSQGWSFIEGASCGSGQVCHASSCVSGCDLAEPDAGFLFFAPGEADPNDACQSCSPADATDALWPAAAGTRCGTGADTFCDPYGSCVEGCVIDGGFVYASDSAPGDACAGCVPSVSSSSYTRLPFSSVSVSVGLDGGGTASVVAGDFNGDGYADVFACSIGGFAQAQAVVLYGQADGGLGNVVELPYATCSAIAVADFNRDGLDDVVAVNKFGDGEGAIYLGQAAGGFLYVDEPALYFTYGLVDVAAGDLWGDGGVDVATLGYLPNAGSVSELTYLADGGLAYARGFGGGDVLALADFDHDGQLDVALGADETYGHLLDVVLSSGPEVAFDFTSASAVGAGDMDGDGNPDLVAGDYQFLSVYRGQDDGGVTGPWWSSQAVSGVARSMLLRDVDGDGRADLLVISNGLQVFLNRSTPGSLAFDGPYSYGGGSSSPTGLAAADLNGDGKPDAIVALPASTHGPAFRVYPSCP